MKQHGHPIDLSADQVMSGPCGAPTGPLPRYDRTDRLREITVPTLFLVGRVEARPAP